jgi:hypothetical protein
MEFLNLLNNKDGTSAMIVNIYGTQVIPSEGEALRSRFMFSTDLADDTSADYPLLYQYGYRISDQEQINLFSTSNVDLQADTILPAGKLSYIIIYYYLISTIYF